MANYVKKIEDSNNKLDKLINILSYHFESNGDPLEWAVYTSVLYPIPEKFLMALVDQKTMLNLEEAGMINWCSSAQTLYPLKTIKDGNCLLHSISMYIWGIEDHLILNKALYRTLVKNNKFKRRYFGYFRHFENFNVYTSEEQNMWNIFIDSIKSKLNGDIPLLSSAEPKHFYIYVIANILKRPILVITDQRIRNETVDNDVVGIYLPLDVKPDECYKYPIVLGFNYNHFTPLVTTKKDPKSPRKLSIPLQKRDLTMLPVRFLNSAEKQNIDKLKSSYLRLIDIVQSETITKPIFAVRLGGKSLPEDLNLIPDYLQDCEKKYRRCLNKENAQGVFENQRRSQIVVQQDLNPENMVQGGNAGAPVSMFLNETEPTAPPPPLPLNSSFNTTSMEVDTPVRIEKYRMDRIPRGICVIFNTENFTYDPNNPEAKRFNNRPGSTLDRDTSTNTFTNLDFIVMIHNDLTADEMVKVMKSYAQKDHSQYDCFICVIMSHGKEDHIYGSDGIAVPITSLKSLLKGQSCPGLYGKPKLFFIQACQGKQEQRVREVQRDSPGDAPCEEIIPDEADFLIASATVPGFVSYRHPETGSWFIQTLCDTLQKYAYQCNIHDILTIVNNEVGKRIATIDGVRYKQSPGPLYTLRKQLFFQKI